MTTEYDTSTRKQLQADRCIGFVVKRTGKPYEGKCAVEDSRLAGGRPVLEIPHSSR